MKRGYGDGFVELEGVIECAGNVYIDVYKRIQILEGDGPNALVQARATYDARNGGRNR